MKRLFFFLIMASTTALFSAPDNNGMSMKPLSTQENSLCTANKSMVQEYLAMNNHLRSKHLCNKRKHKREFSTSYGTFGTTGNESAAPGTTIQLNESFFINTPDLFLVADRTFLSSGTTVEQPGNAIAITTLGIYQVIYRIIATANTLVTLFLNGIGIGGTTLPINATQNINTSPPTYIQITSEDIAEGVAGAALLEMVNSDVAHITPHVFPVPGVTAYISLLKVSN